MKGRQHVKGETSARHATEKDAERSVLPPRFTEILPPFPFKTCLGGAESSELVSRQKSTFSSDCYSFFKNNCIYVAIFGCTGSLLLCKALSRCSDRGLSSSCSAEAPCRRAQALQHTGLSGCRHGLSSRHLGLDAPRRARLPGPGTERVSPALQDGLNYWTTAVVSGSSN